MFRRSVALLAVASIALAGCGDDGPASRTPQIELDGSTYEELLLTAENVSVISGFDGAETADRDDFPLFENPDPRGPCGAPVPPPSFADATGRAITGASINLVQIIAPVTTENEAYVDALAADQEPPCDDYTSETNTGAAQQVSDITLYDVTGDGVSGAAWTSLVEVDDRFVYAGFVALETDEVISFVQTQSATPIPEEGIEALSSLAVLRIRGEI